MTKTEPYGEKIDRWKQEAIDCATKELHKIDSIAQMSHDLRGAIFQGFIDAFRAGHAQGRKEVGK